MNTKRLGLLAVTLAAMLSGSAWATSADDRHYRAYAHPDSYFVPRWARAVGDGWIIGNKPEPGGFAIYRWNGYRWDEVHGAGIRIGGSYSHPWHVNDRGHRYVWNGWEWERDHRRRDQRVFQTDRSYRPIDKFRRDLRRGYVRDR